MDGVRFDTFTRAFGTSGSRRRVLTGLVSGALGLMGLRAADARRCSTAGEICREHANCCSGVCGEKDRTGRRRCQCASAADCPAPQNGCERATCEAGVCGIDGQGPILLSNGTCATSCVPTGTAANCPCLACIAERNFCGSQVTENLCLTDNDCLPGSFCASDFPPGTRHCVVAC
jgi:hypothetical protein